MMIKYITQELKHLHPTVHVHIISRLMDKHPNLHADTSWDVLAKQLFMNYPKVNKHCEGSCELLRHTTLATQLRIFGSFSDSLL